MCLDYFSRFVITAKENVLVLPFKFQFALPVTITQITLEQNWSCSLPGKKQSSNFPGAALGLASLSFPERHSFASAVTAAPGKALS